MRFSIIVPVYNRPNEMEELLRSLTLRQFVDFEVIVIDDGSTIPCREIVEGYDGQLDVRYAFFPNSGPGGARNRGAALARGEYLLFLDSDVLVPPTFLSIVDGELRRYSVDFFGGPDKAHPSFTITQKAINYSMTSFFTTGGIRGGKKRMDRFYPRSFNMGVSREAFNAIGGFSSMRFGEDIDLSVRLFNAGFTSRLFSDAYVWHKRRTNLCRFFKQVHNSGIARIHLYKKHPGSLKPVHLLPTAFTLGVMALLIGSFFCVYALLPVLLYALIVCFDAATRNKSLAVGVVAIGAAFTQLIGYGCGFLMAWYHCVVRGKRGLESFKDTFYK